MTDFKLDARLESDCIKLGYLNRHLLLLLDNSDYPWFILVPQRGGVTEIFQLPESDQCQLWLESARLARSLMQSFHADKINIGALGNLVPQLHIHHIARFTSDPAWPGPVWGHSKPVPYQKHGITERVGLACDWFGDELEVF